MENFQKLWLLLDVVHKAATAGPAYTWIIAEADKELAKVHDNMIEKPPAKTVAVEHDMSSDHPELKKFQEPSPATLVMTPIDAGVVHG